jgi:lysophospholipase L1-like esterase
VRVKPVFILPAALILIVVIFLLVRKERYRQWLQKQIVSSEDRAAHAGQPPFIYSDALTYWLKKRAEYQTMDVHTNDIVFFGDSEIEGFEWPGIKNQGISGDNLQGGLLRINDTVKREPSKIFIELGTNNLNLSSKADFYEAYRNLILNIRKNSPRTSIYIFSLLPKKTTVSIPEYNLELKDLCRETQCSFVPVYDLFNNGYGEMNPLLSQDGIHPNAKGYLLWWNKIKNLVTK